jgi:hypothetical protein
VDQPYAVSIKKQTANMFGDDPEMWRMADAPLQILMVSGEGQVTPDMPGGLADLLNGLLFRGMMKVLKIAANRSNLTVSKKKKRRITRQRGCSGMKHHIQTTLFTELKKRVVDQGALRL